MKRRIRTWYFVLCCSFLNQQITQGTKHEVQSSKYKAQRPKTQDLFHKIPNILKRLLSIREVWSIVVSCPVKLLHPSLFHSQSRERRHSFKPFRLPYSTRQQYVSLVSTCLVCWVILGHQRHRNTRTQFIPDPFKGFAHFRNVVG